MSKKSGSGAWIYILLLLLIIGITSAAVYTLFGNKEEEEDIKVSIVDTNIKNELIQPTFNNRGDAVAGQNEYNGQINNSGITNNTNSSSDISGNNYDNSSTVNNNISNNDANNNVNNNSNINNSSVDNGNTANGADNNSNGNNAGNVNTGNNINSNASTGGNPTNSNVSNNNTNANSNTNTNTNTNTSGSVNNSTSNVISGNSSNIGANNVSKPAIEVPTRVNQGNMSDGTGNGGLNSTTISGKLVSTGFTQIISETTGRNGIYVYESNGTHTTEVVTSEKSTAFHILERTEQSDMKVKEVLNSMIPGNADSVWSRMVTATSDTTFPVDNRTVRIVAPADGAPAQIIIYN